MIRIGSFSAILVAGVVGWGILVGQAALSAVTGTQVVAGPVAAPGEIVGGTADLEMRFVQEGGPDSGQVRVLLTPETRALSAYEARSAAQQAFLAALNEPGLGDDLSEIVVVVRLMPPSYIDPGSTEQVFRFRFKGGGDWAILPVE